MIDRRINRMFYAAQDVSCACNDNTAICWQDPWRRTIQCRSQAIHAQGSDCCRAHQWSQRSEVVIHVRTGCRFDRHPRMEYSVGCSIECSVAAKALTASTNKFQPAATRELDEVYNRRMAPPLQSSAGAAVAVTPRCCGIWIAGAYTAYTGLLR